MYLRKKATGMWHVVVIERGHRSEVSTGTKDEAEARDFMSRLHDGLTLKQLANKYIKYSKANHKPGTTLRVQFAMLQFLKTVGGQQAITGITPAIIEDYKTRRLTKGGVKPTTVNTELRHLKAFFSWLERVENCVESNPVKRVRLLHVPESREPVLTLPMLESLLSHAAWWARPFIQFAFATGMRRNEVIHLRWTDIDQGRRIAYVRNQGEFRTKNDRERAVPLNGLAMSALPVETGELVFLHDNQPIDPRRITEAFKRAVTAASLPPRLRLHSLRHSFCTLLLENGASITDVATIVGHSTIQVTQRYAHLKGGETMHHATDLLTISHLTPGMLRDA